MFDFELFMKACHADLETHAGDVEDYIELDSGDLSNLSDYFSDDFKAKMGAEHMNSAHLVNQLKLESFTQSMSRIALHPPNSISEYYHQRTALSWQVSCPFSNRTESGKQQQR